MFIDGVARRPGLTLAVCAWVGFAALASAAVQQAATIDGSFHFRVRAASNGFATFPSFCLVVAALLVRIERLSSPVHGPAVRIVAAMVLGSAVVAVVMVASAVVVLPSWSMSTSASSWVTAVSPYATAGALAALAALLADGALRSGRSSEYVE